MRAPFPCLPGEEYRHTTAGEFFRNPVPVAVESFGATLADLRSGIDADGFLTSAQVEAMREAAAERAAIVAESGSGPYGLVTVPTTPKRIDVDHCAGLVANESRTLRTALRAVDSDRRKARVAGLRRAVGFSARAIGAALDRPGFRAPHVAMVTLTYHHGSEWRPEHVTRALDLLRKWMKREHGESLRYVWVAELQKRGVLHYHVALWLPSGLHVPKFDAAGWWPHGMSNVVGARKAVPYLLKYLSKGLQVAGFPKGARIHGCGGVDHTLRRARRWLGLPGFVRARSDIFDQWGRAPGGGWSDPDGTVIPSEYERAWVGDRFTLVQVADHGRPFAASGPFTWVHRGPASSINGGASWS